MRASLDAISGQDVKLAYEDLIASSSLFLFLPT